MAAVTAPVVILASAPFLGTCTRIAPLLRLRLRVPSVKLNIVSAPSRVIVRSVNVSSVRESGPVRTAVSSLTSSATTAGRGAARPDRSFTSLITCVTRASLRGVALETPARKSVNPIETTRKIVALKSFCTKARFYSDLFYRLNGANGSLFG